MFVACCVSLLLFFSLSCLTTILQEQSKRTMVHGLFCLCMYSFAFPLSRNNHVSGIEDMRSIILTRTCHVWFINTPRNDIAPRTWSEAQRNICCLPCLTSGGLRRSIAHFSFLLTAVQIDDCKIGHVKQFSRLLQVFYFNAANYCAISVFFGWPLLVLKQTRTIVHALCLFSSVYSKACQQSFLYFFNFIYFSFNCKCRILDWRTEIQRRIL